MMPKKKPARELKLENEIRYIRNAIVNLNNTLIQQGAKDDKYMEEITVNFASVFKGVENELRLLRHTLVLLLLASMSNKKQRRAFLKMVDFVQEETDFQDYIDTQYDGLLNTKKLKDAL
jgi:hypothetical protein